MSKLILDVNAHIRKQKQKQEKQATLKAKYDLLKEKLMELKKKLKKLGFSNKKELDVEILRLETKLNDVLLEAQDD